ncbi:hypothetical protein [Ascidiimonas aurantiaca]|uniref:hypothetical protein n=1 Tax=Ascidiimonas aurantiaca TaxID=1685432 RepID=UPI0030ECDD4E
MKTKILFIALLGISFGTKAQEKIQTEIGLKADFIYKNGNIGIGTTNPDSKLTVNGSITMQSGILSLNPTNESINKMGIRNAYHGMLFYYDLPNYKYSLFLKENGNVGIGTYSTGSHKLAVEGSIAAREVKVESNGWSDFVFEKDYKLPTLFEVEKQIKEKGHLKNIPSAKEVAENGIYLGEMDAKLLQKIEELTLYTIEQEKKIKEQTKEINELKSINKKLLDLQKRLEKLEKKTR